MDFKFSKDTFKRARKTVERLANNYRGSKLLYKVPIGILQQLYPDDKRVCSSLTVKPTDKVKVLAR